MPPEVLLGNINRLEPSIDIWAMGVILFVMLAGKLPFSGSSVYEIRDKICTGKYFLPKSVENKISRECIDVLYRCLSYDPKYRATCQDLL